MPRSPSARPGSSACSKARSRAASREIGRLTSERSATFRKRRSMGLIDRLVEDGYLLRDLNHEFKLIRLTRLGAEASPDDFAAYDEVPERRGPTSPALEQGGDQELSPDADDALTSAARLAARARRSETPFPRMSSHPTQRWSRSRSVGPDHSMSWSKSRALVRPESRSTATRSSPFSPRRPHPDLPDGAQTTLC